MLPLELPPLSGMVLYRAISTSLFLRRVAWLLALAFPTEDSPMLPAKRSILLISSRNIIKRGFYQVAWVETGYKRPDLNHKLWGKRQEKCRIGRIYYWSNHTVHFGNITGAYLFLYRGRAGRDRSRRYQESHHPLFIGVVIEREWDLRDELMVSIYNLYRLSEGRYTPSWRF